MARRWCDLKDDLAWQPCLRVAAPQDAIGQRLQADDALPQQARTGDTALVEAIKALGS
jgi:hypothetical protein